MKKPLLIFCAHAVLLAMALPIPAAAQFGGALPPGARRAQHQERMRALREGRQFGQHTGASAGGTYDGQYATVTVSGACRADTPITLRYKEQARDTLFGDELASSDAYLGALTSTLSRYFSMSDYACESAMLSVYDPQGRMIARDRLVGRGRVYSSEAVRDAQTKVAQTTMSESLFEPSNARQAESVLSARMIAKRQTEQECNARRAPFDACRAQVNKDLRDMVQAAGRGVQAWAARQPASYQGLISLKEGRSAYQSAFSDRSQSEYGQHKRSILQLALSAIDARVDVIEAQLHNQIVADMKKPGGNELVERLFGQDRGRQQAYRTEYFEPTLVARLPRRPAGQKPFYLRDAEVEKSRREEADAAAFARWSEPTEVEIGLALFRALRNSGGRRVNANVTTVPHVLNGLGINQVDAMTSLSMQIYDVRKQRCIRQQQGYRCTYNLYAAFLAGGAYGGEGLAMMSNLGMDVNSLFGAANTATFIPSAGGWRAIDAEAVIARGHASQLNQLNVVIQDVAQAGSSAIGVMQDAVTPQAEDPVAKRQRELRENEEANKRKR